jgi:CSLREA domain-containing protein
MTVSPASRLFLAVSLLAALTLVPSASAAAATFTVDSTADTIDINLGDGLCRDSTGSCTLRAAIMEANALSGVDRIDVPAGNFFLTIGIGSEGTSAFDGSVGDLDLTLNGGSGSQNTQVFGAGPGLTFIGLSTPDLAEGIGPDPATHRVFHLADGVEADIQNVTILNGSDELGGGVFVSTDATLRLAWVHIFQNRARSGGGGLYGAVDSNVTVLRSLISRNTEWSDSAGGAGALFAGGFAQVVNSTVSDNFGRDGAGIGGGGDLPSEGTGTEPLKLTAATIAFNKARAGATRLSQIDTLGGRRITGVNTLIETNVGSPCVGTFASDLSSMANDFGCGTDFVSEFIDLDDDPSRQWRPHKDAGAVIGERRGRCWSDRRVFEWSAQRRRSTGSTSAPGR